MAVIPASNKNQMYRLTLLDCFFKNNSERPVDALAVKKVTH